jgi:hypothetical protein
MPHEDYAILNRLAGYECGAFQLPHIKKPFDYIPLECVIQEILKEEVQEYRNFRLMVAGRTAEHLTRLIVPEAYYNRLDYLPSNGRNDICAHSKRFIEGRLLETCFKMEYGGEMYRIEGSGVLYLDLALMASGFKGRGTRAKSCIKGKFGWVEESSIREGKAKTGIPKAYKFDNWQSGSEMCPRWL